MVKSLRLWIWLALAAAANAQSVDQIMASLADISGLKAIRTVPQERMTREQLRAFFDKRMRESVKPEQTRIEELALKKLGLVPPDFDLGKSVVDLLSEQAAAFYDYQKGKMVMLEGGSGALEQMALVHELAHALADQHFKIEKYLHGSTKSNDGSEDESTLARQAVVEGQAQWLMSEYMARQMGQSLLRTPSLVTFLAGAADPSGQFPVYDQSPMYMRESLVFPYMAGMQFQQAVVARLGPAGFARIFEHPPANSQEILHPDLYLDDTRVVVALKAPEPGLDKTWKEIAEGVVGEFDHQILLKMYARDAMALAAQWRGGHYRLFENKRTKAVVMSYSARWSSPEAAREYLTAYRRVLAGKWTDVQFEAGNDDHLSGTGGGGRFEVKLAGDTLVSLEGLPLSRIKP